MHSLVAALMLAWAALGSGQNVQWDLNSVPSSLTMYQYIIPANPEGTYVTPYTVWNNTCCQECQVACQAKKWDVISCELRGELCRSPCRYGTACPAGTRFTDCAYMPTYAGSNGKELRCGQCCLPGTYRITQDCIDPYTSACSVCRVCQLGVTYASGGCFEFNDTVCSPCTQCKSNQVQISTCTLTADTVCQDCPPTGCGLQSAVVTPVTTPSPGSTTAATFVPVKKACDEYTDCHDISGPWAGCAYNTAQYGCTGYTLYNVQFGITRDEGKDNYTWSGFNWKSDPSLKGWCWRQGGGPYYQSEFCLSKEIIENPVSTQLYDEFGNALWNCEPYKVCTPPIGFTETPVAGPAYVAAAPVVSNVPYFFYRPVPCGLTTDASGNCTVCAPACTSGFYEKVKCTSFSNRVCEACPTNFYCPAFTDAIPCTVCPSGTYQASPCTALTDRVCKPCTVCPENYYAVASCSATADTSGCTPCSNCGSGYESTACTDTSNAVCVACPANSYCDGKRAYALQLDTIYMLATASDDQTKFVLRTYSYQTRALRRTWTLDHWISRPHIHFCPFGDCVMYVDDLFRVRRLYIDNNLNVPQVIYPFSGGASYNVTSMAIAANQTFLLLAVGSSLRMFTLYTKRDYLIAGVANAPGDVDGPGSTARFKSASYISVHPSGAWAVFTDVENYKIKKINLTDGLFTVTTLAGSGVSGNVNGNPGPLAGSVLAQPTLLQFNYDGTEIFFNEESSKKIQSISLISSEITTRVQYDVLSIIKTYFDVFYRTSLLMFMTDGDTGYRDYWIVAASVDGTSSTTYTSNTWYPYSTVWLYKCKYPGYGLISSPSICEACSTGKFSIGGVCKDCDAPCVSGQYPSSQCTPTTNRVCLPCSTFKCGPGQYQVGTCTTTTAPTCSACTTCSPGYYKPVPCTATADASGTCLPCSVCGTGNYTESPCNSNANTVCKPCSNCTSGVISPCNSSANAVCCSTFCPSGQYLSKVCANGTDITCTPCRTSDRVVFYEPLRYCPGDNNAYYCGGCAPMRVPACTPCPSGTFEVVSCNATTNRAYARHAMCVL